MPILHPTPRTDANDPLPPNPDEEGLFASDPNNNRSVVSGASSLESNLRNAWNTAKTLDEMLPVELTTIPPAIVEKTMGTQHPIQAATKNTAASSSPAVTNEEMLAVETKLIPMANSISKAFDQARQLAAAAAAAKTAEMARSGNGGLPKPQRPLKFAASRRIVDVKLLADLTKT